MDKPEYYSAALTEVIALRMRFDEYPRETHEHEPPQPTRKPIIPKGETGGLSLERNIDA